MPKKGGSLMRTAGAHIGVVVLLLALATTIALALPITVSSLKVFLWVPVAYALFVAGWLLWPHFKRGEK